MKYEDYLVQMKEIQQYLVDYFDNGENNIKLINQFFTNLKAKQNVRQIKELLHFISSLSKNYHRSFNFFDAFEEILKIYKEDILQSFSNRQIFRIFRHNKRILLILFETKILIPDIYIFKILSQTKYIYKGYLQYFYPEFKNFIDEKKLEDINSIIKGVRYELLLNPEEIDNNFESFIQKRKKGENDNYICELIRNDAVKDFITYVNKTNYSLSSIIPLSKFETNSYLLKHSQINLIEYASFFGSIQILRYLFMNNVELDHSMWYYSIHGKNPEIIHFLEENKIEPFFPTFNGILIESIKCHHNEFVEYIRINLVNNSNLNFLSICRKYYNYYFFPDELEIEPHIFYDFCQYDYISIVDLILNDDDVHLNDLNSYIENELFLENNIIKIKQTPCHAAIQKGNIEIFEMLLKKLDLFDINNRIRYKNETRLLTYEKTPLLIAVQNYDIDLVKYFLKNTNVDVNLYSYIYQNLFAISLYPKTKSTKMTPLQFAITNEDIQMVELLLSQPNIDENKKSLIISESQDSAKIISAETPLFHAIETQNIEIVKILISRKDIKINEIYVFDENSTYSYLEGTALVKTILLGNTDLFNLLLTRKDIDFNCIFKFKKANDTILQEKSALYLACELQRKEIVSSFISLTNVDVNYINTLKFQDNEGFIETTPLYIACEYGNPDIVRFLLKREDIDINYKSKYQSARNSMLYCEYREKSILHHAIDKENIEVIRILLEHPKLNVNDFFLIRNKKFFAVRYQIEKTALHLAVEKSSINSVCILLTRSDLQINLKYRILTYKFSLFSTETFAETALSIAVENNNIEIVKLLLTYNGIDLTIRNLSGKMPIEIAQNDEIIELLKNAKI